MNTTTGTSKKKIQHGSNRSAEIHDEIFLCSVRVAVLTMPSHWRAFSVYSRALSVLASILRVSSLASAFVSPSSSTSVDDNEMTEDSDDETLGGFGKTSWLFRGDVGIVMGAKSKASDCRRDDPLRFCTSRALLTWLSWSLRRCDVVNLAGQMQKMVCLPLG